MEWSAEQKQELALYRCITYVPKFLGLYPFAVACLPVRGRATGGLTAQYPDPCRSHTAGCWLLAPPLRTAPFPFLSMCLGGFVIFLLQLSCSQVSSRNVAARSLCLKRRSFPEERQHPLPFDYWQTLRHRVDCNFYSKYVPLSRLPKMSF